MIHVKNDNIEAVGKHLVVKGLDQRYKYLLKTKTALHTFERNSFIQFHAGNELDSSIRIDQERTDYLSVYLEASFILDKYTIKSIDIIYPSKYLNDQHQKFLCNSYEYDRYFLEVEDLEDEEYEYMLRDIICTYTPIEVYKNIKESVYEKLDNEEILFILMSEDILRKIPNYLLRDKK